MTDQYQNSADVFQSSLPFLEHRIPRGEGNLYVREYKGDGPAFILLHGFPDNLHIYDRLIPILVDAGRHVVAFDFLGFGASDKPAGYDYSFDQQLGDLEAVVNSLGLDKIVPVGHDAGGIAAINYSLAHPEHVARLGLLNTFYGAAPTLRIPELIGLFALPELKALAESMAMDPRQMAFLLAFQQTQFKIGASQAQMDVIDRLIQPIITQNFSQQPSAATAFAVVVAKTYPQVRSNTQRLSDVEDLDLPATIIWGKRDAYLNTGVAEDFVSHLKKASLHVLDAGHWPQLDLPEEVGRHLLSIR